MSATPPTPGTHHAVPSVTVIVPKVIPLPFQSATPAVSGSGALSIVILGFSGDLVRKKTLSAIYTLWHKGLLPVQTTIYGCGRSMIASDFIHTKHVPSFRQFEYTDESRCVDTFVDSIVYQPVSYSGDAAGWKALSVMMAEAEGSYGMGTRLFYLALPPSSFLDAVSCIKQHLVGAELGGRAPISRLIVEKPLGHSLASAEKLACDIDHFFPDEQIYRIDHYLGKSAVINVVTVRFANNGFAPFFHRNTVGSVQITFKEDISCFGREQFFDASGIIRDVMQNHLLQVLALVAMERPESAAPGHIRDAKVRLLENIRPVVAEDVVLGQYTGFTREGLSRLGYREEHPSLANSRTPTYACTVLWIDNDRWRGVPFIMRAGKGLNTRECTVRIQTKSMESPFAPMDMDVTHPNELVFLLQPREAIFLKFATQELSMEPQQRVTEMELSMRQRKYIAGDFMPEAYERLILDAVRGDPQNFVRRDELMAAWKVFDPILAQMESDAEDGPKLVDYEFGSRGPAEADALMTSVGFTHVPYSYEA